MKKIYQLVLTIMLVIIVQWVQAQNVGINESNPNGTLHIKGASSIPVSWMSTIRR